MVSNFTFSEQDFRSQALGEGVTHFATGVAIARGNKILVVRRASHDFLGGNFELPGGGVDDGETIIESAAREIREETGLTITTILATFEGFDYSTPKKEHVRQINIIAEVADGPVVLDPNEHDDFKWIEASEIDTLSTTAVMKQCLRNAFQALVD